MTTRQQSRCVARGTIPYIAGEYLHKHGPKTKEELFTAVSFGGQQSKRQGVLDRAIQVGWLVVTDDGKITCTTDARIYYDSLQPAPGDEPAREPTAPQYRGDWRTGSLSATHIPNRRGPRADVPAWSVRDSLSFQTKA